jgi:hypothetical protein
MIDLKKRVWSWFFGDKRKKSDMEKTREKTYYGDIKKKRKS